MRRAPIIVLIAALLVPPVAPSRAEALDLAGPDAPRADPSDLAAPAGTMESLLVSIHEGLTSPARASAIAFLGGELPDGCDPEYCPAIRPLRAGDLDGDGSHDLFTSERLTDGWVLRARHGADGSELWHTPIRLEPFAFGYAALGRIHVAGEEAPAIVVLEVNAPFTGLAGTPVQAYEATLDQRVRLLRAASGETIWEHRVEGSMIAGGVPAAGNWVAQIEGMLFGLWTTEDATGDDVADVLVQRIDATVISPAFAQTRMTVNAALDTLSGVTGERARTAELPTDTVIPSVTPMPDISGDGLADTVVADRTTLTMYADGALVWQRPLAGLGRWPVPVAVRLRPGTWDVLVRASQDAPVGEMVTALDGASGTLRWSHAADQRSDVLAVVGDLDGDGGDDVVQAGLDDEFSPTYHLVRAFSGATGSHFRSYTVGPAVRPGYEWLGFPCWRCVQDLTGDGVAELLLHGAEIKDHAEEEERLGASLSTVLDLTTGEVVWHRRDSTSLFWASDADVNANGTRDPTATRPDATLAVEGSTGALIGEIPLTEGAGVEFGAPIDGAAGDELVAWIWEWDDASGTPIFGVEVSGLAGRLWRVLLPATAARPGS